MKDLHIWLLENFLFGLYRKREELQSDIDDIDSDISKLKDIIDGLR